MTEQRAAEIAEVIGRSSMPDPARLDDEFQHEPGAVFWMLVAIAFGVACGIAALAIFFGSI